MAGALPGIGCVQPGLEPSLVDASVLRTLDPDPCMTADPLTAPKMTTYLDAMRLEIFVH
jgi:hypothetical protein